MMKLTPLLAAAFLLAATAPSASAVCIGGRGCIESPVIDLAGETTGTALGLVEGAIIIAQEQAKDADGDNVPDLVEGLICGNELLNDVANLESVPGTCVTGTDYQPPDDLQQALATVMFFVDLGVDTAQFAVDLAEWAAGEALRIAGETAGEAGRIVGEALIAVDGDRDGVPDEAEPFICNAIENDNIVQDGSCVGDDYIPWV